MQFWEDDDYSSPQQKKHNNVQRPRQTQQGNYSSSNQQKIGQRNQYLQGIDPRDQPSLFGRVKSTIELIQDSWPLIVISILVGMLIGIYLIQAHILLLPH